MDEKAIQRQIKEARKRAPNVTTLVRDSRGNVFGVRWVAGRMKVDLLREAPAAFGRP